jgi:hypothetical protein
MDPIELDAKLGAIMAEVRQAAARAGWASNCGRVYEGLCEARTAARAMLTPDQYAAAVAADFDQT